MTTNKEIFGTGVGLTTRFDVDEQNGSIPLVEGTSVIERDVAFTLAALKTELRGDIPNPEFEAEVEIRVRQVLNRDGRIVGVESVAVDADTGQPRTAEVTIEITAANGITEELITTI